MSTSGNFRKSPKFLKLVKPTVVLLAVSLEYGWLITQFVTDSSWWQRYAPEKQIELFCFSYLSDVVFFKRLGPVDSLGCLFAVAAGPLGALFAKVAFLLLVFWAT